MKTRIMKEKKRKEKKKLDWNHKVQKGGLNNPNLSTTLFNYLGYLTQTAQLLLREQKAVSTED